MKILSSLTSPYGRKARIVLLEKKIDCQLDVDIPWDEDSQVPEYNPLGKVPVLVLDDGTALYDSRVIVEYLDKLSPVSRLLPAESRPLAMTKRWEALADGVIDAAVAIYLEKQRESTQQNPGWIERQFGKMRRGLAAMSADLGEKTWCNGESYSLADIAVGCSLNYLDLRFAHMNWREQYPNLAALMAKLEARQSFIDTRPPVL
ncbi:glutathione S-transferase N-terminal domain-containing protein [Rivihabitans pingtungensis]|jgi:glutathione S-transferase|uniref:Glutathione S-transferase n=1 Tax=Rivihabitans pingtungensis TaxID=1054498 RepID=A0A318KL99_9NEIS|nr:glutathione S-transferase N-terminal domain-containing protein [Rivihabitans pingtungensis]MCK6435580.1 glutathione S-transferase N-terminal domain-containing protein [Rivihabitans pingtungensis]PXX77428.1 glutathione S-transferase [Rivihabitans pingtungensis]HNX69658.1 glutathione S-transferase N-terminal domain-containing protein [Rivihabitans pingtungensis]